MSGSLYFRNRQRRYTIDVRHLRRITRSLLVEELQCDNFELGVFLVSEPTMVRLNEKYLRHGGSTDVITFDYCDPSPHPRIHQSINTAYQHPSPLAPSTNPSTHPSSFLAGDIFVCVDEAAAQAKKFRTSWQNEVVRYIVHGVLHLRGFGDTRAKDRRKMKTAEDKLVRALSGRFNIGGVVGHK